MGLLGVFINAFFIVLSVVAGLLKV